MLLLAGFPKLSFKFSSIIFLVGGDACTHSLGIAYYGKSH